MAILEKLLLVKETTIKLFACLIIHTAKNYMLIAIDLSKQQILDADPKATQFLNFTGNLERAENTIFFFIIKEVKEKILHF